MLALMMMVAPALASAPDQADVRQARILAADFCRKAGCIGEPGVTVVLETQMPKNVIAHTTVWGERCVLTFTKETAWREDVVAHEACHCARDRAVIGAYGYEGIGEGERKKREKAVEECARIITRGVE